MAGFGREQVITGDKEVIAMFEKLDDSMKKKALRPVLRDNAKIVLNAARKNLRDQQESGTGKLLKSLKVRAIRRSRVKIGSAVELRAFSTAFYGLFIEFGLTKTTPPRRHRKTGKSTGDLPAQPFLRPALYDNRELLIRNTFNKLRRWITTLHRTGSTAAAGKAVRAK